MNAYDMRKLLRDIVNESSEAHHVDEYLLRRLNMAQSRAARMLAETSGQWLIKRATVTPVASVITLPNDCAKPVYLEEVSSGIPVQWLATVSARGLTRADQVATYDRREAYPLASTIEVNVTGYTTSCYLWYQRRIPDMHTGAAGAATGASALVFAADLNRVYVDYYYAGLIVEVIDQSSGVVDIRSEITDYVASTGVATITGTAASGDTYATVCPLPEESYDYIVWEAAKMALYKPSSTVDKDVIAAVRDEANRARTTFEDWITSRIPEQSGLVVGDVY